MRLRYATLVVIAAATPLLAAACGGDDGGDSDTSATSAVGPSSTASADSAPADSAPSASGEAAIVIDDFAFTVVEAKAGTITIRNDDGAAHTVTADDGSFKVTVGGGDTATIEVTTPGSYPFHCDFHPSMKATLVVV